MAVRIFVSYSHNDAGFRRKLETHLAALRRDGTVETFYDGDIDPGADLDAAIKRELKAAHVFVALASPDYLESAYCFEKEYVYALGRARRKTMHVVVAVIRPCHWKHTRMARYKALPEDGKEVVRWGSRDSAFEDIVNGVRRVVKLVQADQSSPASGKPRKAVTAKPPRTRTTKATLTKSAAKPAIGKAARPARSKHKPRSAPTGAVPKTAAKVGLVRMVKAETKRQAKFKKDGK